MFYGALLLLALLGGWGSRLVAADHPPAAAPPPSGPGSAKPAHEHGRVSPQGASVADTNWPPGIDVRALLEDASIREFVGMSENAWNFANPSDVPGFGVLTAADIEELTRAWPERAVGRAVASPNARPSDAPSID
jgi:hypothetical protein